MSKGDKFMKLKSMLTLAVALAASGTACAECGKSGEWLEYARGGNSVRLAWPEGGKRPVAVIDFGPDCEGGYPEFEAADVEGRPVVRISYVCHPSGLCDTGDFWYETRATYLGESIDLPILPASVNRFDIFTVTNAGRYASPLAQGLVRYVRIALDKPGTAVTVKRFSLANRGVHATERKAGSFDCSDARLAAIWRMSVRTCELSAVPARAKPLHVVSTMKPACDVWLGPSYAYLADGAKRDRLVWSGDLWWAQRNMYAAYGYDSPYMPGSLRMLAENRTPEGYVQACPYPESHGPLKAGDWGPFASDEFAAWFVPVAWDHILHSGDRALAKELYPVVRDLVRYLRAHCRAGGIFEQRRETSKHASALDFGEASTHHRAYMNILDWKVYVDAAKLAEWLGDGVHAAEWRTAAETLAASIRRVFWDADKGRFKGAIETDSYWGEANGLALAAKFCTPDEAAAIRKTLVRHEHGKFQALFVRGLYEYGYADDAVERIFEHGWDDVLDESWQGPRLTSECMMLHTKGWGDEAHPDTAIAGILSNYILGVEPTEPGYAKYRVNPRPSKGVTSASGVVPTPWGALHVAWKLENGKPVVNCREERNGVAVVKATERWKSIGNRKARVVHWGIIHNHSQGKWDAVRLLKDDFEMVGWVDDRASKAMRMKEPDVGIYTNLPCFTPQQVFEDVKPDLIIVETANSDLVEVSTEIAKHGIPMHMDKPLGSDLEGFRRMSNICEARGVPLQIGYMFRANEAINKVVQLAHDGVIGEVFGIDADLNHNYGYPKYPEYASSYPGGTAYLLACHVIEWAMPIFDDRMPDRTYSIIKPAPGDPEGAKTHSLTIMEYPRANVTIRVCSRGALPCRHIRIDGTNGTIELEPIEDYRTMKHTTGMSDDLTLADRLEVRMFLKKEKPPYKKGLNRISFPMPKDRYAGQLKELARILRGEIPNPPGLYEHDLKVHKVSLDACNLNTEGMK